MWTSKVGSHQEWQPGTIHICWPTRAGNGDHPGLAVTAEVAVETSGPKPHSVKDVAQFIALSGSSTSLCLVEALVLRLTVSVEEHVTLGQSSKHEWKYYRVGVITVSTFHSVYTIMKLEGLIDQLLGRSTFSGNAATRYGTANESTAATAH